MASYTGEVQSIARQFEFSAKMGVPGAIISSEEGIVKVLAKLDREALCIVTEVHGTGPASEGYMFINSGIPTICGFGAEGNNVHSVNEYLRVDSLPKILEMYVRAAIDL